MSASAEFKLSITRALSDQLDDAFAELVPTPLTAEAISALEKRPGVYRLFLREELVYIGKASKSLPSRLGKHLRKLGGRLNIALSDIAFTCLYVDEDLDAVAPERMLIRRATDDGLAAWNNNGFGNNDPGRERDSSEVKPNHFDALYPIDLDVACTGIEAGTYKPKELFKALKRELPFNFRFAKSIASEEECSIKLERSGMTAREIFASIVDGLPDDWQLTALPGYVIAYPERPKKYREARETW